MNTWNVIDKKKLWKANFIFTPIKNLRKYLTQNLRKFDQIYANAWLRNIHEQQIQQINNSFFFQVSHRFNNIVQWQDITFSLSFLVFAEVNLRQSKRLNFEKTKVLLAKVSYCKKLGANIWHAVFQWITVSHNLVIRSNSFLLFFGTF